MILSDESPFRANLMNLYDDALEIVICNPLDGHDLLTTSFYNTLELQDLHVHNYLYDYGASHSLMPLVVMEKLGLEIIGPYKDLYSFDSKRVQCFGMISGTHGVDP